MCVEFSCQQLLVADGFLDAMDEATLAEILSSAGGSEFCAPLTEKLSELNALSVGGAVDKKAILTLLKDVGCSKMGTRQKLATVLMCELQKAPGPAAPADTGGADFWTSLISGADAFDDIPPPTSAAADMALLSAPKAPPAAAAVAPLPPEVIAADAARRNAAPPTSETLALVATSEVAAIELEDSPVASAPVVTAAVAPTAPTGAAPEDEAPYNPAEEQANLFRKLGDEALGRKDYNGAERWFTQALAATPHSAPLLARLAQCALSRAPIEHARALRHLKALLALPPPHGEARIDAASWCALQARPTWPDRPGLSQETLRTRPRARGPRTHRAFSARRLRTPRGWHPPSRVVASRWVCSRRPRSTTTPRSPRQAPPTRP